MLGRDISFKNFTLHDDFLTLYKMSLPSCKFLKMSGSRVVSILLVGVFVYVLFNVSKQLSALVECQLKIMFIKLTEGISAQFKLCSITYRMLGGNSEFAA